MTERVPTQHNGWITPEGVSSAEVFEGLLLGERVKPVIELDELLTRCAELKCSDLFIKSGVTPNVRLNGRVITLDDSLPPLSAEDTRRMAFSKMTPSQIGFFEDHHEMDLAFTIEGVSRIRGSVMQQRGTVAMFCRLIPIEIPSLADLGLPEALGDMTKHRDGLVLVTGPTGCGKSTTLASLVNMINESRRVNIITIEDPIEYVHRDKMAIVSQREVGIDTDSFQDALRHVLRQTPDIIMIGEMRDLETMNVALQAAETGHLVFATLHTASAAETLDRLANMFQPHERPMLWLRLSTSLRGVVSQKLIPNIDGTGRLAALEIMLVTPTIAKMLEEGRSDDIYGAIRQAGLEAYWGMETMNQCLVKFTKAGLITEEDALHNAGNYSEIRQLLRR